jgi:hypothetical protein
LYLTISLAICTVESKLKANQGLSNQLRQGQESKDSAIPDIIRSKLDTALTPLEEESQLRPKSGATSFLGERQFEQIHSSPSRIHSSSDITKGYGFLEL